MRFTVIAVGIWVAAIFAAGYAIGRVQAEKPLKCWELVPIESVKQGAKHNG